MFKLNSTISAQSQSVGLPGYRWHSSAERSAPELLDCLFGITPSSVLSHVFIYVQETSMMHGVPVCVTQAEWTRICRPILLNNAPDNTYSWTLFIILPWMSCFLNLWAFCEVVKAEQVRLLCCSGNTSGLWFDVSDVPHVTQINTCCRELKDTKQMNQFTVTEVTFSTRVKQDSQMHSLFYLVLWLIATV